MKGARGWIVAGLISIAIAAAAYFVQPGQDSPERILTRTGGGKGGS